MMRTLGISLALSIMLAACGGGGGGGGGTPGNTQPPGSFTVSATTVSFSAKRGLAVSPPQVLHVHLLDNAAAAFGAAYVAPQTQPSWLNVAITGTSPDFDVNLSITSTALPVGKQSAVLTLGTADSGGNVLTTQNVTITLTILEPIGTDVTTINQNLILGQPAPSASTVNVTADQSTQWTVGSSAPWLSASVQSGSGSAAISITVDPATLGVGTAMGTITIVNTTDATDMAAVTVTVTVQAPTFAVSPSSVTIGGTNGLTPGGLPVQLSLNTGANTFPWTATVTTSTGGSWLTLSAASGTVGGSGASVTINGNYTGIAPGSYTGSVMFQTVVRGVTRTQTVAVTLNKEGHWLVASTLGAAFASFPSRSVLTRTLQVASSQGRTDVPWTAQADQPWLAVTPSGMTGGALTLTANPTGLTSGQEYIANVTISSSDATILNTQTVRVGLWIGTSDPGDVSLAGTYPYIAANPVEPEVYVSDQASNVLVYDVYGGTLLRTLSTSLARTADIVVSSDGATLFVNDATNLEVVALDPKTGATLQTYPWGSTGSNIPGGIVYVRPGGQPTLVLGDGLVFDVASGTQLPASFPSGYYYLVADPANKYIYAQTAGLSPSTLTQYPVAHSALTPGGIAIANTIASASGGSNGEQICVSSDGSSIYTANGAPYQFESFTSAGLQPGQILAAVPYPDNAECGWNGLFVGGANAYYNAVDVWVYEADGTLLTTLNMNPAVNHSLIAAALVLSGDDTRVIGSSTLTSSGTLDFHSIPAP